MTGAPELARAPDVCLVTMPYASPTRPSMALGLLKAILAEDGITAAVAYANLWFAESVGLRRYSLCASNLPIVFLAGEWTFAGAAFGDDPRRAERDAEYLRQVRQASDGYPQVWSGARGREFTADLLALRAAATEFVDEAARRVLATGARVVGCTSTFEQHVASLALLRRVRELDPGVITILGGANCETVMGEATHRCFGWVDYVVSGEADGLVTELCRLALTRGRDVAADELPRGVLGPAHRTTLQAGQQGGAGARPAGHRKPRHKLARALFSDLDSLPTPRYEDYFETLAASPLGPSVRPGLPLESSRGCWWGAAHQCTFCGLNGTSLGYRSKSPGRVLAEVHELEDRYGISDFEAVDNILDMSYHKALLPDLAADPRRPASANGQSGRRIFYEIKANVTRAQVAALVDAGIMWAQPGIESLHSEVLALMDKGIQGWQNVQLLKWARELGLRLSWSILWGFPGEKDDWYQDMAQWLPALAHLPPPAATPRVRFDRYSVYHEQAAQLGLILFPIGALSLIYPAGPGDLDALAYFFTTEPNSGPLRIVQTLNEAVMSNPGIRAVTQAVRDWSAAHRGGDLPVLAMEDRAGALEITDTRACARTPRQLLTGLARAVLLACDSAPRPARLAGIVSRDSGITASQDEINAVVRKLRDDRLVLVMDDRLVGLVLHSPVPDHIPDYSEFPGGGLVAAAGEAGRGIEVTAVPGKLDEAVPRAASSAVQASWLDNQSLVSPSHQLRLDEPLLLDGGRTLPGYVVNFETYGTLSPARDNAILVCHSLTSRAHAAGRHAPDDPQPGWWDAAIGPGKMLDTKRYFVICADALGAGQSTGPASPDPETGRRYGVRFPVITVRDMVRAQHRLVQRLGIERLHAVVGGCMGGQQAAEWAIAYPGMTANAVVITTTPATSAHTIAIFSVMRHLIRADPQWHGGDYYGRSFPVDGLNAAVAAAVPLWMSREAMETRFGRRSSGYRYTLGPEFAVEAFIGRLVAQARHELDPNGLMYLMRAVEYFDLEREYGSLEAAFEPVSARVLFVSYRQDWRYPAAEAERMREAMTAAGGDARHLVLDSAMGHGAFLYEVGGLAGRVCGFLGAPVR